MAKKVKNQKLKTENAAIKNQTKTTEPQIPENWQTFCVFKAGHRQFLASAGETLDLPFLKKAEKGKDYSIEEILLIAQNGKKLLLGKPYIAKAKITLEIIKHDKTPKKYGLKFKAKSRYRRRYGYRQKYTQVYVKGIQAPGIRLLAPKLKPKTKATPKPKTKTKTKPEPKEKTGQQKTVKQILKKSTFKTDKKKISPKKTQTKTKSKRPGKTTAQKK